MNGHRGVLRFFIFLRFSPSVTLYIYAKNILWSIVPSLKRTKRLGFPRKSVNHFAALSPSSKAEPDHSQTETPSDRNDGLVNGTWSSAIPGARTTAATRSSGFNTNFSVQKRTFLDTFGLESNTNSEPKTAKR